MNNNNDYMPPAFAVWHNDIRTANSPNTNFNAAMFVATPTNELTSTQAYSLSIIPSISFIIKNAVCVYDNNDKWFNGKTCKFIIKKTATVFVLATISFENHVIIEEDKTVTPVIKIHNKFEALCDEFTNIETNSNATFKFCMKPNTYLYGYDTPLNNLARLISLQPPLVIPYLITQDDIIPALVPPNTRQTKKDESNDNINSSINHIIKSYIVSQIAKEECCPITMEKLIPSMVSITDCGHLMEYKAAKKWILDKKICPVCRKDILLKNLQKYVV